MIEASLLPKVLDQVANRCRDPAEALARHLRSTFPGVHFTVCSDDDMPARLSSVADNVFCRLYYVAASDHCLTLTADAAAATGLVVALCEEDND